VNNNRNRDGNSKSYDFKHSQVPPKK